jgi:NADH:ubiquinone oxidoreductase subunit F (NADH-binding)
MSVLESIRPRGIVVPPIGVNRLFAAGSPDLADHVTRFGAMPPVHDQLALIDELQAAGLDGRGGAGFPTWRKIAATRSRRGGPGARDAPVVIANGAEGEPLSSKDATLLRYAPHLVIDGLLLTAAAVGARDAYLYGGATALTSVARALRERADAGRIVLREAPDTFVSGEASAVVNGIEKGLAIPRDRRVRLTTSGLGGRPTLVNNVETLAHIALIARFGAAWFRSVGTDDEPGTRLLTVSGDVVTRQVIEAAGGIRLDEALRAVGAEPATVRAVLVGGYHGGWVPGTALHTPVARRELAPFGASPGAGVLAVLRLDRCGLRAAADIAGYLASQSAGQCGPCVNGLPAMAAVLHRLAATGRDPGLPDEVRRLAALVAGRGSCAHPDGTARLVLSSVTVFASDVAAHLDGRCEAMRS